MSYFQSVLDFLREWWPQVAIAAIIGATAFVLWYWRSKIGTAVSARISAVLQKHRQAIQAKKQAAIAARERLRQSNIRKNDILWGVATLLVLAAVCWYGGVWVSAFIAFVLAFILGMVAFSPAYAIRSADAFARGDKWLLIFTRRKANRLMQRIKGDEDHGKPIDFIGIVPPGLNFYGETNEGRAEELTREHPKFWGLVRDPTAARAPTGIEIHRFWFVRLWMAYINIFTDVILVGPRKLFDIYTYSLEKTRYRKKTEGALDEYIVTAPDPSERSNHVRISPFQWPVMILGAETHDRVSWSILVVANLRSVNPWMTLHNHENWSQFTTTTLVDALVRGLRNLTLSDVMGLVQQADPAGAITDEQRDKIIRPVYDTENRLTSVVGLVFDEASDLDEPGYSGAIQLMSVEPTFRHKEDEAFFTRAWRARQEADAQLIEGEAEALRESIVIGAVATEVAKHGKAGELTQRMQALENAAKTGKSTLIFDTGNGPGTSQTDKLLSLLVEQKERELSVTAEGEKE